MNYVIEIGSNYEQDVNVPFARRRLASLFPAISFAPQRETAAIGMRLRTTPFINQVATFSSVQSPDEVKTLLKAIEREAGRTPEEKKQEIIRLDIDLLACDDIIYKKGI